MEGKQFEIRKGETLVSVPHEGGVKTFVYSKHGPGNYVGVARSIEEAGLLRPTMGETASLVYPAFFSDEKEFSGVKDIMKGTWLWAFTGTLYVPGKGAYVQDNPEIRDGKPFMDESELVKRLEANEPSVRFEPFGFKTGEMSPIKLVKNRYVVALAGEEGAEKLAEVAYEYKKNPYLWSYKSVDKPLTRVSALGSGLVLDVGGLGVYGDIHGVSNIGGCAFGVRKTGEASRAKKILE